MRIGQKIDLGSDWQIIGCKCFQSPSVAKESDADAASFDGSGSSHRANQAVHRRMKTRFWGSTADRDGLGPDAGDQPIFSDFGQA
jgi:hypothetical protein